MNDNKRRAIVWDTIERLAFRPSSDKDRDRWLGIYTKTLYKFWGVESTWDHFANGSFSIPFLDLKCDYKIETADKYSALLQSSSASCSYWQNHIDPEYPSKASLHSVSDKYPLRQHKTQLRRDTEAVLNGMIFHSRCHAHLEDLGGSHVQLDPDKDGLSSHEIRIGGGIENPYVFLFHVRYQFCLVSSQVRQTEKMRLIDLFENAIKNNAIKNNAIKNKDKIVNVRDLFDYQR